MRKQGRTDYDGLGSLAVLLLVFALAGFGITYALCQTVPGANDTVAVAK